MDAMPAPITSTVAEGGRLHFRYHHAALYNEAVNLANTYCILGEEYHALPLSSRMPNSCVASSLCAQEAFAQYPGSADCGPILEIRSLWTVLQSTHSAITDRRTGLGRDARIERLLNLSASEIGWFRNWVLSLQRSMAELTWCYRQGAYPDGTACCPRSLGEEQMQACMAGWWRERLPPPMDLPWLV